MKKWDNMKSLSNKNKANELLKLLFLSIQTFFFNSEFTSWNSDFFKIWSLYLTFQTFRHFPLRFWVCLYNYTCKINLPFWAVRNVSYKSQNFEMRKLHKKKNCYQLSACVREWFIRQCFMKTSLKRRRKSTKCFYSFEKSRFSDIKSWTIGVL